MSALSIQVPFPVFQDRDGQPLDNGYVWIGVANLNPQTNPVVAYFDAALTIVAAQPLRTLNGYISRAGSPAQIYVDGVNFSILVQDSKGSMVYNFPDGSGISPNAAGVVYTPAGTGAVATTVQAKLRESVSVTDWGVLADGTDQTALLVAKFTALGADYAGQITVPFGVKFDTKQVWPLIPRRAFVIDNSSVNAWNSAGTSGTGGYLAKTVGYVDGYDSSAGTDLTWQLSSGHNASLGLDNRGEGTSSSALGGVAAVNWTRGQLTKGQPGLRQLGRYEFAAIDGDVEQRWAWQIRRYAPWRAQRWEYWAPNTTYATDDYIFGENEQLFRVTVGGTSGVVAPDSLAPAGYPTNGTMTLSVSSYQTDLAAFTVNENGGIGTNTYAGTGVVAHFKSNPDNAGTAVVVAEAVGASKNVQYTFLPTNSGSATVPQPSLLVSETGWRVAASDFSRNAFWVSNERGLELEVFGHKEAIAVDGDTTPSVQGCAALVITNTGATSITDFDNATATQQVILIFQNANTTLVHGNLILKGGINVTSPANGFMTIKKYSDSSAWFEMSRSW